MSLRKNKEKKTNVVGKGHQEGDGGCEVRDERREDE
jgi:hypothetical protein